MTEHFLQVRAEGSRLRCILDRRAARNALNTAMLEQLLAALAQAGNNDALRCITLESADPAAFCAGIDLRERRTLSTDAMAYQSGLVLALVIINSGEGRVPWTFVMTGGFFLLAVLPPLMLRERARRRTPPKSTAAWRLGWAQLVQMKRELPKHRTLLIFFGSMLLFMAGLTAVVAFA